jgi:hypothetical protein
MSENQSSADHAETPQMWRNQLIREMAETLIELAPLDRQTRLARILRNLDSALGEDSDRDR